MAQKIFEQAPAQVSPGNMYALGRGVPQDAVYAYMWANISASNGVDGGGKVRDRIAKTITPAQIAEAQGLARECIRKKYKGCQVVKIIVYGASPERGGIAS